MPRPTRRGNGFRHVMVAGPEGPATTCVASCVSSGSAEYLSGFSVTELMSLKQAYGVVISYAVPLLVTSVPQGAPSVRDCGYFVGPMTPLIS